MTIMEQLVSNTISHYLGDYRSLVLTDRGDRMIVDTRDMMITPSLLCWGSWEANTASALDRHLKPGMKWIDIGANIGHFTVIGRRIVGSSGFTYAFEANPRTYSLLVDNMNLNWFWQSVQVEQKAVSHENSTLRFVAPTKYAVNGTVASLDQSNWAAAKDDVEIFNVEGVTLDSYLAPDVSIDLIKMDIEGSELGALRGARRTLSRLPNIKVMLEWSPDQMEQCGFTRSDLVDEIKDLGFNIFAMEDGDGQLSFEDLMQINHTTMILLQR